MPRPMLRLPSIAVPGWASKSVAPLLGIKSRSAKQGSNGFPLDSPTVSGSATVHRQSFVLEHSDSRNLEEVYDVSPGKELGAGGYGTVHKASLKGAETVARAIKTVKRGNLKAQSLVRREIAILRRLDHPCICRLYETFEDRKHIYLVLELIEGRELFDEIADKRSLDEVRAARIMQQVFGALHYCHEQKVIHRDLKPENIMVRHSANGRSPGSGGSAAEITLIDFGMSVMYEGDSASGASGSAVMGSSDYLAPEAMRGRSTAASDVWSSGMVLHALLAGCLPTSKELLGYEPMTRGATWEDVSPAARRLVCNLLQVDPSSRLSATEAAGHIWTRGGATPALLPSHANHMMENFMSFHCSVKLRRAALTALAMQLMNQHCQREQFMAMDTDGNGRISKQELIDSISAATPLCPSEIRSWANSVFDSIDTDGSQEIDYTEWLAAAMHESACRSEQSLRAAFRVFDADGDGRIDEAEFARVLMQTPAEIASLLPQFDANGDGVIDFEEFKYLLNTGVAGGDNAKTTPQSHRCGPTSPKSQSAAMTFSV